MSVLWACFFSINLASGFRVGKHTQKRQASQQEKAVSEGHEVAPLSETHASDEFAEDVATAASSCLGGSAVCHRGPQDYAAAQGPCKRCCACQSGKGGCYDWHFKGYFMCTSNVAMEAAQQEKAVSEGHEVAPLSEAHAPALCTCTIPNALNKQFRCNDGSSGVCAANKVCYSTGSFAKGEGCRQASREDIEASDELVEDVATAASSCLGGSAVCHRGPQDYGAARVPCTRDCCACQAGKGGCYDWHFKGYFMCTSNVAMEAAQQEKAVSEGQEVAPLSEAHASDEFVEDVATAASSCLGGSAVCHRGPQDYAAAQGPCKRCCACQSGKGGCYDWHFKGYFMCTSNVAMEAAQQEKAVSEGHEVAPSCTADWKCRSHCGRQMPDCDNGTCKCTPYTPSTQPQPR